MSTLKNALPAFAIAAGGVGLAWLGYRVWWLWPVIIVVGVALIGAACNFLGRSRLESDPVGGTRIMWWRFLMLFALGAGAAGLLIALAVWFEPDKDAAVDTKKLLTASLAALTTLIVAVLIKSGEEAADQWVGKPIQKAFKDVFGNRFDDVTTDLGKAAHLAIWDDAWRGKGWSTAADRRARAEAVAAAL